MNKAKQLIIAVMCGFEPSHHMIKDAIDNRFIGQKLLDTDRITKSDLFSDAQNGKNFFEFKETWENIDSLIDMLSHNNETITCDDLQRPLVDNKSAVDLAASCGMLERAFSPKIWKGQMAQMEKLWFNLSSHQQRSCDFLDIRRQVARAEGHELREDALAKVDISVDSIRTAARRGDWDNLVEKMNKGGLQLTKEDLFLPDTSGDGIFDIMESWDQFEKIHEHLINQSHESFDVSDFLYKRGDRKSPLEHAANYSKLDKIFNAKIWAGNPEGMLSLYNKLGDTDKEKVDVPQIMTELVETTYGDGVRIDETLSISELTRVMNMGSSSQSPVRPLGLKKVWDKIDDVRNHLRARSEKITLDELRLKSGFADESCLMVGVRNGRFKDIMCLLDESRETLSVDDLIAKNKAGKNVVTLLAEQDQLDQLINPQLWIGRGKDLLKVWDNVPHEARQSINFEDTIGQINRLSLREKFGGNKKPPSMNIG
jgi:hypothetical protein